MNPDPEVKSRRIALITSIGVHVVILLLLLFIVAWRAPNPPLPEFGIELNFGMDAQGSGNIQPQTPVSAAEEPVEEEQIPEALPVPEQEEVAEEVVEQPTEQVVQSVEPEVTSKTESPVVVEEKKETKKVETPKETPAEKKAEPKPEVKPEVKEVPKAVYKPKTETTEGKESEKPGTSGSHGDDVNKAGDKGDPAGTLDAKALYGKQGGGGGGVSMSGFGTFGYPDINTPQLPNESNGIYEFRVHVDEQGYVTRVETVQRGLSIEAERRLKATIQRLQFIPKGNPQPAEGRIIFKVVSE